MGNELQRQQYFSEAPQKRHNKIFHTTELQPNRLRPSIEGEISSKQIQVQQLSKGKQSSIGVSRKGEDSNNRQRKYLSLTKEVEGESKMQISRSNSSKQKKGINLTTNSQSTPKYSIAQVINYDDPTNRCRESNFLKKNTLRPRDLPRHSSQKIIPTGAVTSVINPFSAKILPTDSSHSISRLTYPHPSQPQITIKYAYPFNPKPPTESRCSTIQSSNVTPFRPTHTSNNWMQRPTVQQVQVKRLKKVPMARSYDLNTTSNSNTKHVQNQQESIFVKEVSDMTKLCHNIKQQRSNSPDQTNKENLELFTDKKPPSSITSKTTTIESFKQSESKYALAYERNGVYIEKLMDFKPLSQSFTKESVKSGRNKYSVAVDKWMAYDGKCQMLQAKVDREVISNPVIQQPFRFPTATDISEDDHSNNTSFLPITKHQHNQNDSFIQLSGEDIVKFCKPKINSKVLADMLKLPLKN